jgi:hypothetical protein
VIVAGATHFSVLAAETEVLAQSILADRGPEANLAVPGAEIERRLP